MGISMGALYDRLTEYGDSNAYPYHMPGHKRYEETHPFWKEYYKRDITEIDGFDDLHHADGILKEAMERAAKLYHSEHTYFLVNGSTAGVLTAIMAAVPRGGSLILMRGSHKSAYHALLLGGIRGVYLPSVTDAATGLDLGVTIDQVAAMAEAHPEAKAVFLTSPTYAGFSMPLREIAEMLHKRDLLLIVDAAHGAHFGMADYLPENAVEAGADIVIHSLHKTLPSPTQTALLHVNGSRVDVGRIERYFSVFQTTSPSYVLMAGIDECICTLQDSKERLFADFYRKREKLHESLSGLNHIRVVDTFSPLVYFDEIQSAGTIAGGIVKNNISSDRTAPNDVKFDSTSNHYIPEMGKLLLIPERGYMTARELYDVLREQYQLQPEMAAPSYVLLFLTVADTEEGYQRLSDALYEIDNNMEKTGDTKKCPEKRIQSDLPEAVYSIAEADAMEGEWMLAADAVGRISQGFVTVYPPGQPMLVPGERITEQMIKDLQFYKSSGCEVQGVDVRKETPEVLRLLCIKA